MTEERVAIITGGSKGIGLATVAAFARLGVRSVAFGRNGHDLASAIDGLDPALRPFVGFRTVDVRDGESIKTAVDSVASEYGRLDILVNSAGVSTSQRLRLVDSSVDEWHANVNTNLTGTYLMCHAALPYLEQSQNGYLFNVLSIAVTRPSANFSTYAASKSGAAALTAALVEEYRSTRLRVTSVSPGPVATTIWTHKKTPPTPAELEAMLRPGDIAETFVWLLGLPQRMHVQDVTVTPWHGADVGASI
jgi:NADP-dependent 3-hydroxy acid dehydrogenase YdfG